MKFMLITKEPEIAKYAESCGVERIFVDMETLGKEERQGHLDTHRASHSLTDLHKVRSAIRVAELMVRINPLNVNTIVEVDAAIDAGAERIMLPMFRDVEDVKGFKQIVKGRVPTTFLAETPKALVNLPEWVRELEEDDQIHFGLNDLSLAMDLDFLFEILAARMLDYPATVLRQKGVEYGIGGVARLGVGPLSASSVIGEHVRLGSDWAILSRAFHGSAQSVEELRSKLDLEEEMGKLQAVESEWRTKPLVSLHENQQLLAETVFDIAQSHKRRK